MTARQIRRHGRWLFGIVCAAHVLIIANEATGLARILGIIGILCVLGLYISITLEFDRTEK